MKGKIASQSPQFNVLLIEEDPKQTELYADLIREVADCKIDVASRVESSFDWVARSNYHLVVLDASAQLRDEADGEAPSALPVDLKTVVPAAERPASESTESKTPLNSLDTLEQLRRLSPSTSVILMSGRASVEEAVAAIRLGAEDYLKKPFNPEAFQLAVKRGLDRKTVFGENTGVAAFLNLLNSCQMISASLEQGKIFDIVQSYLSRELHAAHSVLYTMNSKSEYIRMDLPGHTSDAMDEIVEIAVQAANPFPKMIESQEYYRFVERGQLTPGLFLFRFRCAGPKDCFSVCLSPQRPSNLEAFESRLRMLKSQIEVTGKNIEQYMGVQHLVYVDDATGLYNTRYLHYILDREIVQYKHTRKSFAVLFIDVDKFKGVNDTYGHLIGTQLLNELGHQLKRYVRESDTVFRYGGDEFVAVLSPCDLATANAVAERIRYSVEQTAFLERKQMNIHFTVSIGVALFPDHAESKEAVIDAADQAMYTAKRTTRNSVFIAPLGKPGSDRTAAKV